MNSVKIHTKFITCTKLFVPGSRTTEMKNISKSGEVQRDMDEEIQLQSRTKESLIVEMGIFVDPSVYER